MATNNRKQSLVNQVNRLKEQIAQKEETISKLKSKPSGGNNSSDRNSIELLKKQIMNLKTQITKLKSEIAKL